MTFEQAKEIIKTYTLPMTAQQMEDYKKALQIVSGHWGNVVGR